MWPIAGGLAKVNAAAAKIKAWASCGLNHVSWSSPQLAVSQWVLSQRNYLFIKEEEKKTAYWLNFKNKKIEGQKQTFINMLNYLRNIMVPLGSPLDGQHDTHQPHQKSNQKEFW